MFKKLVQKIICILIWAVLWQLIAAMVSNPLLVPGPLSVLSRMAALCTDALFWQTVSMSLLRITSGTLLSVIIGALFAVACCRFHLFELLLSPLMSIVKATPVASFIILALLWLDRDILPAFISVLIVVPVVTANLSAGIRATDGDLLEVAKIFKFGFLKKLKRLYLPSVYPYFISACRSSFGLAWKAGIAAEVLAVPALSVGKMIYDSKLYLETTDLFAWTAVVIILSVVIESVFCALFKRFERSVRVVADN